MGSSLVKIDVHIIFHVKKTSPRLKVDDFERIWAYIGGIIRNTGGLALQIGGVSDHIHILSSLPKTMSIADFVRTIKIESSKWIKNIDDKYQSFAWQNGYGAFSVSPSAIPDIMWYIKKQQEHHRGKTFAEEYHGFLNAYGIEYDDRYVFND
ncbi:MAG: transposase [Proteobacteria bacterium]|nr:transposase [Pseudomonadota bacterium]